MSSLSRGSAYATKEEKERHRQELSSLTDVDGATYRFVMVNGVPVSPFPGVRRRVRDYGENFGARGADVWICAFVKSGTHWVNEMAHMLLRKTRTPPPTKEEFMAERVDRERLKALEDPRLLNTHLGFSQLPRGLPRTGKIIFITRDVRDVAVSQYYHVSGRAEDNLTLYKTSWRAYLDTFQKGLLPGGEWFAYTKEWHECWLREGHSNTLVLHYEAMLLNRRATVEKLAKFLLTDAELENLPKDFIDFVVQKSDFQTMKKARSKDTAIPMYRKGIRGDWRNHFSDLDIFNFKAQLFDGLPPDDQRLFLHYASMGDWR